MDSIGVFLITLMFLMVLIILITILIAIFKAANVPGLHNKK